MTISEIQQIVGTKVDGIMGPKTKEAIKAYQTMLGVTADGIWGPKTQAAYDTKQSSNSNSNNQLGVKESNDPSNKYDTATGELNPNYSEAASSVESYTKAGDTPSSYYNKTEDTRNTTAEARNLTYVNSLHDAADSANIVDDNFLNTIASDASIMAFYVNALTYGGYTMGDILNDMKRRELISKGGSDSSTLKSVAVIDPEQTRTNYLATAEGQKAVADTAKLIPTFNFQGLLNPDILKYGANMPEDLFKKLVPILDPESDEFKDAVEEVKSKYFDLASAQLDATTEQDKAVADYNLKQFKEQLETSYGIALSDDATKAWNQIETLADTYGANNILNSGLHNEVVDKTLQNTRKADQRLRDEKLTKDEQNQAAYYRASATDEEINKLTPEQRKTLGLTPSADVLEQFSIANLKAKNPSWSDEMVQQAHDSVIDKYGNYRSAIYSKYYSSVAATGQSQQTTAVNAVTKDSLNKEATAYEDYTANSPSSPKNAFMGEVAQGAPVKSNTELSNKGLAKSGEVAGDIKTKLETPEVKTPVKAPVNQSTPEVKTPVNQSTPEVKTPVNQSTPAPAVNYTPAPVTTKPATTSSSSSVGKNITSTSTATIQKAVGAKADGIYGADTTAKVKAFQAANGLVADGIVGPKTLAKMNSIK